MRYLRPAPHALQASRAMCRKPGKSSVHKKVSERKVGGMNKCSASQGKLSRNVETSSMVRAKCCKRGMKEIVSSKVGKSLFMQRTRSLFWLESIKPQSSKSTLLNESVEVITERDCQSKDVEGDTVQGEVNKTAGDMFEQVPEIAAGLAMNVQALEACKSCSSSVLVRDA